MSCSCPSCRTGHRVGTLYDAIRRETVPAAEAARTWGGDLLTLLRARPEIVTPAMAWHYASAAAHFGRLALGAADERERGAAA